MRRPDATQLFHFSDDPAIDVFVPRPVAAPTQRAPGAEWQNGALVWAIDDWHQPLYFFPRECPRILLWHVASTCAQDRERFFGDSAARMLAFVEERWQQRLRRAVLYRYSLPREGFIALDDAGMWVAREPIQPLECARWEQLPTRLEEAGVELRALPSFEPLRGVWDTSLHASGIRLRNARGWS